MQFLAYKAGEESISRVGRLLGLRRFYPHSLAQERLISGISFPRLARMSHHRLRLTPRRRFRSVSFQRLNQINHLMFFSRGEAALGAYLCNGPNTSITWYFPTSKGCSRGISFLRSEPPKSPYLFCHVQRLCSGCVFPTAAARTIRRLDFPHIKKQCYGYIFHTARKHIPSDPFLTPRTDAYLFNGS